MLTRLLYTISIIFLTACSATGNNFTKNKLEINKLNENESRIYVFRTGDSIQYAARAVDVKIDGSIKKLCAHKGFNVVDVPSGKHKIQTDLWDSPGKCIISVNLLPNTEYFFEIKPRKGNMFSSIAGGIIGAAIESGGKECGGAFSIEEVETSLALEKIKNLKLTK